MNEKHTYSGDRTKNHFTAYLLEFIKGRRSSYLDKKIRTEKDSFLMEEIAEIEERITFEEMSGQAGAGKTMLAVCILNYLRSKQPQAKCLFISVTELADLAFSKYHKEEHDKQARYNQAFKDIEECDLLVLDDLGTESSMTVDTSESSNTVQKMLFRIGDLMQGKRLVITTNNNGDELTDMYNPKIISRLLTSNQDHILKFENVEDYRQQHN